jgi:hypothetical protein
VPQQRWISILGILIFCNLGLAQSQTKYKRSDFVVPLKMEFGPAQGKALAPDFEYAIEPDTTLIFSNKIIRTHAFRLELEEKDHEKHLRFSWPPTFLPDGELQVVTNSGQTAWRTYVSQDSAELKKIKIKDEEVAVSTFLSDAIGNYDLDVLIDAKFFKFCFFKEGSDFRVSYCSGPLALRNKNGKQVMVRLNPKAPPVFTINGNAANPNGVVNFNSYDTKLNFTATFTDGGKYEIASAPTQIQILDAVRTGKNLVRIQGLGGPPTGENVRMLDEDLWEAILEGDKPILNVFGTGEVPFQTPIVILGEIPSDKDRPQLVKRSKSSTYDRQIPLQGLAGGGYDITTDNKATVKSVKKTGRFLWTVDELEKGVDNRRSLLLKSDQLDLHTYYEVFRGYRYELSTRLTGVLADTGLLFFGELAGTAWFERLGSSNNYWLSDRRWGVSAKYFTNVSSTDSDHHFQIINLDAKYRLTPGVWSRDATFGAILGVESFRTAGDDAVNMVGVGAMWARSMPVFFDQVFNIIPWFRYPKWVDAEFIYYPVATSSEVNLGANFKLAFHGKMNFTPRFYLEAGFGLYNIEYTNPTANRLESIAMSYGTGGFGVNF